MAWIAKPEALARLNIKPQTLYAYVSRGLIAARAHPGDARASLYSQQDIEALARRLRGGRKRREIAAGAVAWGDPICETRIATVRDGRLIYAGHDAVNLAEKAALEDVARLLWGQPADWAPPLARFTPPAGQTAKARGLAFLSARAAEDAPSFGRARAALAGEAFSLVNGLADAFFGARRGGPFHQRLAGLWRLAPAHGELVRRAIVLVADHELNPSTFAARVAASTGASLAACTLAGYATLTGPLHGEASARAVHYLREAERDGAAAAIAALLARGAPAPAIGHPLYPSGDPRAAALIKALKPRAAMRRAIAAAEAAGGAPANIDMALAAMTVQLGLPDEAPFVLFAAGRSVGWLAHAIEQRDSGQALRPRAAYVGP